MQANIAIKRTFFWKQIFQNSFLTHRPVVTVFCIFTAPCSCMSFNLETRRLSLGMDTGSICVSYATVRLLLFSSFLAASCRSRPEGLLSSPQICFVLEWWQHGPVIAAPPVEHNMWNSSVTARISFNVLAVLQCSRDVFLVFVYSNQKGSLVSHCELWVESWANLIFYLAECSNCAKCWTLPYLHSFYFFFSCWLALCVYNRSS